MIRVYANGSGGIGSKGSHLSVFACIVEGKYDDDLNWPFVGTVTVELLNQLKDKGHYSKVIDFISQDNLTPHSLCWGFEQFYPIMSLRNFTTQYLENDTLYFRIYAQASGHRPWLECKTDIQNEMEKI